MSDASAGSDNIPGHDHEWICREFEAALRAGRKPTPESFLIHRSIADRTALIDRLRHIERTFSSPSSSIEIHCEEEPGADHDELQFESTLASPPDLPAASQTNLSPGDWIGRYQLKLRLGAGGFGEVWQAHDPVLDREVALKTLRADKPHHPEFNQNLVQEGQKLAKLSHPSIVRVLDAGEDDGRAFLVSELKRGGTLRDKLRDTPQIPMVTAVEWVIEIATAVQFAHERGFVHRDLKPGNILFDNDNKLSVCDFGISASELEQLTEEPAMIGTLGYMSPEQAVGNARLAGPTSDVYSMGAILYALLTGRLPYVARTPDEYREQVLSREPRSLRSINPQIPQQLEDICLECLAKEPSHRPPSAQALAEQLRNWLQQNAPHSVRVTPWLLRRGTIAGILTIFLLSVAVWQGASRLGPQRTDPPDVKGLAVATQPEDTLPERETVRPAWTTPEVICWSPHSDFYQQHGYIAATKKYAFETSGASLFQCGESDGTALRLAANFHIHGHDGLGTAGFFWSLNPNRERSGFPSCWGIRIGRTSEQTEFGVSVRRYDVGPGTGRAMVARNLLVQKVPAKLAASSSFHLEVNVSSTRIDGIAVNGEQLLKKPILLEVTDWSVLDAGGFGFSGKNGLITVKDFEVESIQQ